jgi:hypothetical protein
MRNGRNLGLFNEIPMAMVLQWFSHLDLTTGSGPQHLIPPSQSLEWFATHGTLISSVGL